MDVGFELFTSAVFATLFAGVAETEHGSSGYKINYNESNRLEFVVTDDLILNAVHLLFDLFDAELTLQSLRLENRDLNLLHRTDGAIPLHFPVSRTAHHSCTHLPLTLHSILKLRFYNPTHY